MKTERRIEKFLKRINVTADAERKQWRLEEILEASEKQKNQHRPVSSRLSGD